MLMVIGFTVFVFMLKKLGLFHNWLVLKKF
jgi:hypothetical protein